MRDEEQTREQLLLRVAALRHRVAELEALETEHKWTEEALRASEETARALLNASNDSALLMEPDGTIVALNETTVRQLGKSVEGLVGTCVFDLFPPDVAEHRKAQNEKVVRSGTPVRYEDQRTGTWFDNSVYPVFDAQGKVVRLAVFARDITQRKQAEETLKRRAYHQERLLETARYLTSSLDLKEVLTRIALGAKELLEASGCTIYLLEADGEILTPVVAFDPFYEKEILSTPIHIDSSFSGAAIRARRGMIFNDALQNPIGCQIPDTPFEEDERVIVTPLVVDDQVLGATCIDRTGKSFTAEDLALAETFASYTETALKNARTHQALQQEVEERHRAEEALYRSLAELRARNEELDAFAHTVAHGLQNPIAVIIGTAEVLEQDCATMSVEELRQHLGTIGQSGRKIGSIIGELLLLAQVRKGEVAMEPLDMASIVAEAQQRLADLMEAYQVEIVAPDTWPMALGYRPWIEEVWVNYLSNAIKYGGQPPRVELGYSALDSLPEAQAHIEHAAHASTIQYPISKMIRFWVRDNGPGLTVDEQARLFTSFTRLDRLRARGYGLGLSIVRRIVEKLGGQVAVESAGMPGQGSVFSFTLPAAADS
jgi:PAS domain S-box-containing protein